MRDAPVDFLDSLDIIILDGHPTANALFSSIWASCAVGSAEDLRVLVVVGLSRTLTLVVVNHTGTEKQWRCVLIALSGHDEI
jgi:hypothetical protein